ncbi:MAG TPA: cell wall-binding repeat-containing protein [Solirubrobacteraceae bacterium]|nr:cell wall-binding repeat-containing protein [Solirubrobacteraceae bacterium]
MSAARGPRLLAALALASCVGVSACGKSASQRQSPEGSFSKLAPVAQQGAVSLSTRNTTRLGGVDVAEDAAAVARTVYPGLTAETRPRAVVLASEADWTAALAASVLASSPIGAPLLYSEGETLPEVTRRTLEAVRPTGLSGLGGAQVIQVGTNATVGGLTVHAVPVGEPAETAAAIERLLVAAAGGTSPHRVIVLAANAPRAMQMPAAGLAAQSGAPILFVTRSRVPIATAGVLASLHRPSIYVVGAASVGARTLGDLRRFGPVATVSEGTPAGTDPASANAIAVSRFTDGVFGWGVKQPGHGLAFANSSRPLDAPAAAPLSASGDYAPLLLLEAADQVPPALAAYLVDIQPGYTSAYQFGPARSAYNHGWLIGDEAAISAVTQAELDSLLETTPRVPSAEEASVAQSE